MRKPLPGHLAFREAVKNKTNKNEKKYALSEQGAKDLIKGCLACVLQNLSLMFPVGLLYYMVSDLMNGGVPVKSGGKERPCYRTENRIVYFRPQGGNQTAPKNFSDFTHNHFLTERKKGTKRVRQFLPTDQPQA